MRRLDHFNQADQRKIGNSTIGVVALYGAIFCVFLGVVIINQSVGIWVASGTQAEIMSSPSGVTTNTERFEAAATASASRHARMSP